MDKKEKFWVGSNSKVTCKGELVSLAPLRRGGSSETATSTPVLPWKQHGREVVVVGGGLFSGGATQQGLIIKPTPFSSLFLPPSPPPIPARRLAAAVWELIQYFSPSEPMQFGGDGDDFRIRLHQHHHQRRRRDHHHHYLHHRHQQEKGNGSFDDQVQLGGPSYRSPEHQPPTASSLRRQVAMLLAQHHQSTERNPPPQPPSPASYGSSLEINARYQASTPMSSIELKGRTGESSFGFKTSTELLKVLNRIWTLEEQHMSNISLVKALKTELDHARTRIRELLRDQQTSRHEIDELMKQVAKDKLGRKSKEQERIHVTISSLKDELEDERKLRKHSEGLHRRLAREIFEVKVTLSTSLKEVERERTSRCLLEDLCDEFAKGILEYERDAHSLRQKNEKNQTGGDRLIVHMCESWLDERIQIRDQEEAQGNREMVVEKMRDEIENFLQHQKMIASKEHAKEHRRRRRNSLESFPLNDGGSAPRYTGNEDSAVSTLNLYENTKAGDITFESRENEEGKDPIGTKNKLIETKAVVNQEKADTEVSPLRAPDKGKGAISKPVSELLEMTSKNTLKAKLQEPRTRVGYRSRLKILKGSS